MVKPWFHSFWFPVYQLSHSLPSSNTYDLFLALSLHRLFKHKPHSTKMHYVSSSYYIKIAYSTLLASLI